MDGHPAAVQALIKIKMVREEVPGDAAAIRAVRELIISSTVAVFDANDVGNAAFSRLMIRNAGRALSAVALAPVAVMPDHQRRGIGSS